MNVFKLNGEVLIAFIAAMTISLLVIPALKEIAGRIGLLDKPNGRKVHVKPIPVIGGLAIGITIVLALFVSPLFQEAVLKYAIVLTTSLLLMIVGILDDRLNLRASHRLIIQMICGYAIAASGIRITSLYGILGIVDLNIFASYALTIFLICGVVNAFNLIDGIDGLAGLMSLLGFALFGYLAWMLGDYTLLVILAVMMGAISGFLRYNLSVKKIFLGDGGSLLLGFILVVTGVQLIELSNANPSVDVRDTVSIVFGIFLIPVLDSLRVYYVRMKNGFSPFRADKNHIHHLFLYFDISHQTISSSIAVASLSLISIILLVYNAYGLSSAIIVVSILFITFMGIISAAKNLGEWKQKIGELENRD
ncbi:MAG: glycosyltransferase family 4 protein [Bacteroidia bacterium]